jgi:ribosomal-protein-alanine N-acetyltransferase
MITLLETARLRLRPFTKDDAPAIFAYARDPEIARLGMWSPSTSLEETRDEIGAIIEGYQRGDQWTWAIEQKYDQTLIGRCDLLRYRLEHRSAEIGYALARNAWGRGYATEAVRALVHFGFDELALHRLEAIVLSFNAASIRVLEKIGMQREGVKREAYFIDGRFVDLFCYGLLTPGR